MFQSPVGELHFSIKGNKLKKRRKRTVSVPCRGTTFLNSNERLTVKSVSKFPSPVGELHFSMIFTEWQNSSSSKFPSPVGELHFSIISPHDCIRCAFYVSVPCRGTTFLNNEIHNDCKNFSKCFRPLSGNYISQCVKCHSASPHGHAVSVPCRGTTFLNSASCDCRWMAQSFRPLSGNYISQSVLLL